MNRIFTLSPGRSGTHWLSMFFCLTTRVPSTTKPEYFADPRGLDYQERIAVVDRAWKEIPENYVNTSLVAKLGYLDLLSEKGARFIYLGRPERDNAYSWYANQGVPGRTERGLWYHPDPSSPENVLNISEFHQHLTDYQLCYWLCIEIHERAKKLAMIDDVYFADIEKLSRSRDEAEKLLKWTKIPYDLDWWELLLRRKVHAGVYKDMKVKSMDHVEMFDQERDLYRKLGK